jgi:iron donor protein CyaY
MMNESLYRTRIDETLKRIDAAFEDVDPDLAESDYAQGTLVITFRQAHKLILSPQAPLRQLWLAFHDRAWHFGWDDQSRWLDDRGQGVELLALIVELAQQNAGIVLRF